VGPGAGMDDCTKASIHFEIGISVIIKKKAVMRENVFVVTCRLIAGPGGRAV